MRRTAVELLAPAKINLALHIVGRREDGLHLLDSIVVFADVGDRVSLRAAARTTLSVSGPFATSVPADENNLALRAARLAGANVAIAVHKALPVGAGIGGGSSDAAAVLRGVLALGGETRPDPLVLGADVPVCLAAEPARMRGVGEDLLPLPILPNLHLVLIRPGVAVSTGAVFAGLANAGNTPLPPEVPRWNTARDAAEWLGQTRNDLEEPALHLAPVIAEAKAAAAAEPGCLLARMSGSGSTVFGLFSDRDAADKAAQRLARGHPGWWVRSARVLSGPPAVQESRVTT